MIKEDICKIKFPAEDAEYSKQFKAFSSQKRQECYNEILTYIDNLAMQGITDYVIPKQFLYDIGISIKLSLLYLERNYMGFTVKLTEENNLHVFCSKPPKKSCEAFRMKEKAKLSIANNVDYLFKLACTRALGVIANEDENRFRIVFNPDLIRKLRFDDDFVIEQGHKHGFKASKSCDRVFFEWDGAICGSTAASLKSIAQTDTDKLDFNYLAEKYKKFFCNDPLLEKKLLENL